MVQHATIKKHRSLSPVTDDPISDPNSAPQEEEGRESTEGKGPRQESYRAGGFQAPQGVSFGLTEVKPIPALAGSAGTRGDGGLRDTQGQRGPGATEVSRTRRVSGDRGDRGLWDMQGQWRSGADYRSAFPKPVNQ